MKLASTIVFLLALVDSAVAFDLSEGDFLFGKIESDADASFVEDTATGPQTDLKDFTLYGAVPPTACFNVEEICDLQVYGDLSWIFCLAAHKALSKAKLGFAVKGTAEIGRRPNNRINEVTMTSTAASALLVSTFVAASAEASTGTDTRVKVLTESDTNGSLQYAASLALGEARGQTIAASKATSLNSVATGSKTLTSNKIHVSGGVINNFVGTITGVVGLFSSTSGLAGVKTHAKAASEAFAVSVTAAQKEWSQKLVVDLNKAGARAKADAASKAFGTGFAASISRLAIIYKIMLSVQGRTATLSAGGLGFASFSCAPVQKP